MGFPHEDISTLKERIQQLEGIPVSFQTLYFNGRELFDTELVSKFSDREKIFLSVKEPQTQKAFKFHTILSSGDFTHAEGQPIDIYLQMESSAPISLKTYREIWESMVGAKYKTHYELHKNGECLDNDDTIISENRLNEYQVFMTKRTGNFLMSQTWPADAILPHRSTVIDKFFSVQGNELSISDKMRFYKMQATKENQMDVQKVNWKQRPQNTMFFLDDDEDPFNGDMLLFQKTRYNKFEISNIRCHQPNTTTD